MTSLVRSAALAALVLSTTACFGSTPPSRFYVLTPLEDAVPKPPEDALAIRVGPVELPKYLAGPEIVTRTGNELQRADLDRWAEPLEEGFARALTRDLAVRLGDVVTRLPWERGGVDIRIGVAVDRFDVEGDLAVLEARWSVSTADGERVRTSRIEEPVGDAGYRARVAALSRLLAAFSAEVAQEIRDS